MQLRYLQGVVDCNNALVWGRNSDSLDKFEKDMKNAQEDFGEAFQNVLSNADILLKR